MSPLLQLFLAVALGLLALAGVLHFIGWLGASGGLFRRVSDVLCRAPLVDVVLFAFTAVPWIVGAITHGWLGVAMSVGAQVGALWAWIILHEITHPAARKGPRIYRTLDGIVGRFRNHFGMWWTAWVVPVFWGVRFGQYFVYPVITWTTRLPKYRQGDWVNMSRQKFSGLVGYDLIWCLYCDWMTGVWSLGSEMLRNVESFWCPIRFYSEKKCENCKVDFPDVAGGWVAADGTMQDVTKVLQEQYGTIGPVKPWFGHPARLTIDGADPAPRR
ncbi:MAG: hypothetical protein HRU76_15380 [Phycisphaeraceae bacterium]|nr:hypothetical protein [Phycisphaerales bacterium]QOJ18884.1 MAG: hypothetical protein HRU76_15380 [Phycisphaeraceae bacterium]